MEKKCGGDYPVWGFEQTVPDVSPSEIIPVPAAVCEWCDYIDACRIRVVLLMNMWVEIDDEQLEEFRILSLDPIAWSDQKNFH